MSNHNGLCDFLHEQCKQRGLSLRRLSINSSLSPGTVHNIIKRKYQPTLFSLNRLADYLGVKREYLWQLAGLLEDMDYDAETTFSDPQLSFHFGRVDRLPDSEKKLIISIIEAVITRTTDSIVNNTMTGDGTQKHPSKERGRRQHHLGRITERMLPEEALVKAKDDLEIRVKERTAELAKANEDLRREMSERKHAEDELRALSRQLVETQENERRAFSRELHDQVGQFLTTLGINLNIVQTQLPEESTDLLRSRLDESLSLVEQTAERIRDVMANLRPPVLDDYGLVSAVRWYGEQFATRADIAVAVEGKDPVPRLDAQVENALFRIAQEALANAAKHAKARQVTVTIEVHNGTLRMIVADDGVGFDPARLATPGVKRGWGLLTMRERAEVVGGVFRIESHPGSGTRLIVEVAS